MNNQPFSKNIIIIIFPILFLFGITMLWGFGYFPQHYLWKDIVSTIIIFSVSFLISYVISYSLRKTSKIKGESSQTQKPDLKLINTAKISWLFVLALVIIFCVGWLLISYLGAKMGIHPYARVKIQYTIFQLGSIISFFGMCNKTA